MDEIERSIILGECSEAFKQIARNIDEGVPFSDVRPALRECMVGLSQLLGDEIPGADELERRQREAKDRSNLLNRAMTVVEATVAWQHDDGHCHFCAFGMSHSDGLHDKDCPLVAEGFIERTGERT